jgi:hypothetical protein
MPLQSISLTINGQAFLCQVDGLKGHYSLYIFKCEGLKKKFEKRGFQPGDLAE